MRAVVARGFPLRDPSRQCRQHPPQLIPRFVTIAIRPSDRDEVAGQCDKSEIL
jgi:hypothetical protein